VLEFDTEDVPWKWVVVGKLEGQGVEGGNEERGTESYVGVAAVFSRDFLVCGPKLLGSGLLLTTGKFAAPWARAMPTRCQMPFAQWSSRTEGGIFAVETTHSDDAC
jgi:hypothetical protein